MTSKTSKEALSDLFFLAIGDENHTKKCKEIIEKDLDKLEELQKENQELKFKNIALELWNDCYTKENAKLKKTIEILKNKKVNIFHIWALDDYKQYKQYYFFDENHTEKDMLTIEEFKFLKEVLEC